MHGSQEVGKKWYTDGDCMDFNIDQWIADHP